MVRRQTRALRRKQRERELRALKAELNIIEIKAVVSTPSRIWAVVARISTAPSLLFELFISTLFFIDFVIKNICHLIGSVVFAVAMPPVQFIGCYTTIFTYSVQSFLYKNEDKEVLAHEDLFIRMKKMEKSFVGLHNKYEKLKRKVEAQDKLLQSKKAVRKVIHIYETKQSTIAPISIPRHVSEKNVPPPPSMAPVVVAPPPPPPMAPPPPMLLGLPPLRKLNIPKRTKKIVQETVSDGISLQNVLGARGMLKKVNRTKAPLPKPSGGTFGVSMMDITSIKLKRTSNKSSSSKENEKANAQHVTDTGSSIFRLKNTGVLRSPGGTPMKSTINENMDSPANIFTNALREKFKHTRTPEKKNVSCSPYQSPSKLSAAFR